MNHSIETMLKTNPAAKKQSGDLAKLAACIDACFGCAQACTVCADSCLVEANVVAMVPCIRFDLACAEVCFALGRTLSRLGQSPALTRALAQACAIACGECATECEKHAGMNAHCKACAEACRVCEAACKALCA